MDAKDIELALDIHLRNSGHYDTIKCEVADDVPVPAEHRPGNRVQSWEKRERQTETATTVNKNGESYYLVTDRHSNKKEYVCLYCGFSFPSKFSLIKHRSPVTEQTGEGTPGRLIFLCKTESAATPILRCQLCDKAYKTQAMLKNHLKVHSQSDVSAEGPKSRQFECSVCYKRFSQDSHLKNHMAIHTGDKVYQCQVCRKRFTQSGHLYNHTRTHTGEKNYRCELCDKRFVQKVHLKNHLKIHTGEKDHRCILCDKVFTQSGHLQSHMRTHTGERKYRCPLCEMRFRQSGHLTTHMKLHRRNENCDTDT